VKNLFIIVSFLLLFVSTVMVFQTIYVFAAKSESKYPSRNIEILVGYDPGSGSDLTMRAFAPFLSKILGQPITAINIPGAGGILSWNAIARAKPDGYTLCIVPLPAPFIQAVLSKVNYDPMTSFTWLGQFVADPVALVVKAGGPYKTFSEFIDVARKNPGKVTIGSTGKGSMDHSVCLGIEKSKNVKFNIVNFDGGATGITAVMGDNLSAMALTTSVAVPYEKAGTMKTLGVGGDKPFPQLPSVPTFKSQGVDLFAQSVTRGLVGPKGLPADVYNTLVKAIKVASGDAQWKAQAEKMGLPPAYISPEQTTTDAKHYSATAQEYFGK